MTDSTPDPSAASARSATPHFVNREPWDPYVAEKLGAEQ